MYKTKKMWWPVLLLADGVGYLLFGWRSFFTGKIDSAKINKILVVILDNLGDLMVATPSLKALRKKFPDSEIDVLLKPYTKELLTGNKSVNHVFTIEPPWLYKTGALNLLQSLFFFFKKNKTLKELKEKKYDLSLEFHGEPRNNLLMWRIGAKYRLGHPDRGLGFLLTHRIPLKDNVHVIDRNLSLVEALGCDISDRAMDLAIPDTVRNKIERVLKSKKLAAKKFVGMNPGTGRPNKYWTNKNWAKLADKIYEIYRIPVVFFGSKGDLKDIDEITREMKSKAEILAGKLDLIESAAAIEKCRLFICTDTGPMHIAKALGTPLIGLFGPVNPKDWGYKDLKSSYVSGFEKCTCKYLPDCTRKKEKYRCMLSITPEKIIEEVKKLI